MTNTWDRQPKESSRAHAAFKIYLEMGPQRSLAKVAKHVSKSTTTIGKWSGCHAWVARVRAWEMDQDKQWDDERRNSIREACRRHAALARSFSGKIAEKLRSMQGKDIKPADLAKWLDVAVKIERLALGMSTDAHEISGKEDAPPIALEILNTLPDTQLLTLAKDALASLEAKHTSLDGDNGHTADSGLPRKIDPGAG